MSSDQRTLLLRADGGLHSGYGHIIRSLALANAWCVRGGRAFLLTNLEGGTGPAGSDVLLTQFLSQQAREAVVDWDIIAARHPDHRDLEITLQTAGRLQAEWVAVDGYHFTPDYHQAMRSAGFRLLVIDDTAHLPQYAADILLNQNHLASQLTYDCPPSTCRLLGTSYTLLRPQFNPYRSWQRQIPAQANRILITLGGSDQNQTLDCILDALEGCSVPDLQIRLILPQTSGAAEVVSRYERLSLQILGGVTDIASQMAWAHLAISGGGSTCWEMAFMGLPALILTLAENQREVARAIAEEGAGISLGRPGDLSAPEIARQIAELAGDAQRREGMCQAGRRLIDGNGALRVVERMSRLQMQGAITLRRATEADRLLIWEWANDAQARAVSFNTTFIPWEDHCRWFQSKLQDADYWIMIAEDAGTPFAQVRFEVTGEEAITSIYIEPGHRGKGYAAQILRLAVQELIAQRRLRLIHAYIKSQNPVSYAAFRKAGFSAAGMARVHDQMAQHVIFHVNEVGR